MAPSLKVSIMLSVLLLIFSAFPSHASQDKLPENMHQDMYCIGCEMTMKVLDRALRHSKQPLEDVRETLSNVCKPDHFDISEYPKDPLSRACKHIIKKHEKDLEAVLVSFYSQGRKRPSYLDMVQRVCLGLTDACHGVLHDDHDHDPLRDDARVKLDPETNRFVVLPGKKMKVANPVMQVHEEL